MSNLARVLDEFPEPASRRVRLQLLALDEPEEDCCADLARCSHCGASTLFERTIELPISPDNPGGAIVTITTCSTCHHPEPSA